VTKEGELRLEDVQPPQRVVAAAAEAPNDFRPLAGVVTAPTLRPDGSLIDRPGYDAVTGLYYDADAGLKVTLSDRPTLADALRALAPLRELIADFPFEKPCHESAALAALLTVVARHAFEGCAPLFLVDANRAGTGKGLLVDVLVSIATGAPPACMSNTTDDGEMRKRLLALALEGCPVIKVDNVGEFDRFGTPALDSALTAGAITDRVLGSTRTARVALGAVWFCTGNNVSLTGDMPRRVCHVRLLTPLQNPEERPDLRYPNLLAHARERRGEYLSAALCLLRAWFLAGRPARGLPAWGSFEGWSAVVRECLVWVGLPDPHETRVDLLRLSDTAGSAFDALVRCWAYAVTPSPSVSA
jgi:hypothetical protein